MVITSTSSMDWSFRGGLVWSATQGWIRERTELDCWTVGDLNQTGRCQPRSDSSTPRTQSAGCAGSTVVPTRRAVSGGSMMPRSRGNGLGGSVDRISAPAIHWQLQGGLGCCARKLQRRMGQ